MSLRFVKCANIPLLRNIVSRKRHKPAIKTTHLGGSDMQQNQNSRIAQSNDGYQSVLRIPVCGSRQVSVSKSLQQLPPGWWIAPVLLLDVAVIMTVVSLLR
ncbi:hypothetical protein [Thioclava sp. SK-1]|uniref:hypothetical protein n=1 Tax=Thioclava sp. SK-1 TaxID=1889770 RepID=UPI00114CAB9D|nr:hypothetical protein [Thioclava sp. SK-1]